jgi:hypothetical protein
MDSKPFQHLLSDPHLRQSAQKIWDSCLKAKEKRLDYLWDDTRCIDKSANAKENLNESLASMSQGYRQAKICLVYLSDVFEHKCGASVWFVRGWTLQELLAPTALEFFDQSWHSLGDREQLSSQNEAAIGIAPKYLNDFARNSHKASLAAKMSWAAERETQRVEDRAYNLFGIFNVAIDIRYGEGKKTFRRSQGAIIHEFNDESIFAWRSDQLNSVEC